jgi:cysteine desulfurase/selenocysteine lyase
MSSAGPGRIRSYEHELLKYAEKEFRKIPCASIIGSAKQRSGILSFIVKDRSPEEIARALDREGIAVRAGHHCAQPILRRLGQESTIRISFALYNTCEEVDRFIYILKRLVQGSV